MAGSSGDPSNQAWYRGGLIVTGEEECQSGITHVIIQELPEELFLPGGAVNTRGLRMTAAGAGGKS